MIYKCENCKNRNNCKEKQDGYKGLCQTIEKIDASCWSDCYYSLTLKCDYWVEDKETYNYIGEVPYEQGGEQE